jgi:hypothetical protein
MPIMDRRLSSAATSTPRADRLGNGPYIMEANVGSAPRADRLGNGPYIMEANVGSAPRADRNGHTVARIKSYGI